MNDVTTNPVFVDGTGRRSRRVRRLAYVATSACTVYMVVVGASLAAGQRTPMMELPFGEEPTAAPAEVPPFLRTAPVLGASRAGGTAVRGSSARGVQVVDLAAFVAPATRPATRVAGVAAPLQATVAVPAPAAPAPAAPVVTPPDTTPTVPPTAPPTVPPTVPPVTGEPEPGGSEGEPDPVTPAPVTPPPVTPPPATPDPVVPDPEPVTPPTSTPVEPSTDPEPTPPAVDLTPLGQVVDGLL